MTSRLNERKFAIRRIKITKTIRAHHDESYTALATKERNLREIRTLRRPIAH